jgi:hypothetical protein
MERLRSQRPAARSPGGVQKGPSEPTALKGRETSGEVPRGDAWQIDAAKLRLARRFGCGLLDLASASMGMPDWML